MLASLVSVRERVLFVLALRLALWKCWLAAMTQRYSIREGKSERRRFGLSLLPKCATGLRLLSCRAPADLFCQIDAMISCRRTYVLGQSCNEHGAGWDRWN